MKKYQVKQDSKQSRKLYKPKKRKTAKLRDLSDLKRELWYWTSLACRLRDADDTGYIVCPVCKTTGSHFYKGKMQAGHFVRKSRGGITEYMLENLVSICSGCNIEDSDYKLSKVINDRYSAINNMPFSDYLFHINRSINIKKDRPYFDELIPKTKQLVLDLSQEKNLWDWKEGCLYKYKNSYNINI